MVSSNGQYIIVISPRRRTRHATSKTIPPGGPERIGKTLCGKKCNGWPIDGEASKTVQNCKACTKKMG
jgi:hypothetical protein